MSYETLRLVAAGWLVLAVALMLTAIAMHHGFDIPAVRRILNGETARRQIARLRGSRPGSWRYAEALAVRGNHRPSASVTRPGGSLQTSAVRPAVQVPSAGKQAMAAAQAGVRPETGGTPVAGPKKFEQTASSDNTVCSDHTVISDNTVCSDHAVCSDHTVISDDTVVSDSTVISDGTVISGVGGGRRRRGGTIRASVAVASAAVAMTAMGSAVATACASEAAVDESQVVISAQTPADEEERRTIPTKETAMGYIAYQGNDAYDLRDGDEVIAWGDDPSRAVRVILSDVDVDSLSLSGTYHDLTGAERALEPRDYLITAAESEKPGDKETGTTAVNVTLRTPGSYDFSHIAIRTAEDAVIAMGDLVGAGTLPDPLTIGEPAAKITAALTVDAPSGDTDAAWHAEAPQVGITVSDNRLLSRILAILQQRGETATPVVSSTCNGVEQDAVTIADLRTGNDGRLTWAVSQPHAEGWYAYSLHDQPEEGIVGYLFGTADPAGIEFGVDATAPAWHEASGPQPNTTYGNRRIHAAVGEARLTVALEDAPSAQHTGGVSSGPATVRVTVPAPTDLQGEPMPGGEVTEQTIAVDPQTGQAIITLTQEGLYDLNAVRLVGVDHAGNTVASTVRALLGDEDASALAVIAGGPAQVDAMTLTATPAQSQSNARQGYFSTDVAVTCTVRDPWFPLARNVDGAETVDLLAGSTVERAGASGPLAPLTLQTEGWERRDGERWTITVPVRARGVDAVTEGTYTLRFSYQGLHDSAAFAGVAGESLMDDARFVIDLTPPRIEVGGVKEGDAYSGTVAPLIGCADANLGDQGCTVSLSGARQGALECDAMPSYDVSHTDAGMNVTFWDFARHPEADDVYTLTATATDAAGNVTEASTTFSVNRFGSTYAFDEGTRQLRGTYLSQARDVEIREFNVSGLQSGESRITVVHNDRAETLSPDEFDTRTDREDGYCRTTYTIPARRFAGDGFYRVLVRSVDLAGNVSENTMEGKDADRRESAEVSFAVDSTAPTVSVPDLTSGATYAGGTGKMIAIDAKDNLGVDHTELRIDGRVVREWNGDTSLGEMPRYELKADGIAHDVTVSVADKAGNQTSATYDAVTVGAAAEHGRPPVIPCVIGLVSAAGAVAVAVIRRRRTVGRHARRRTMGFMGSPIRKR